MRILKSRFIRGIMILGFSLVIIAAALSSKTNRLPGKVAGTVTNPLLLNNKFCDNPASVDQVSCTGFIPGVLAAVLTSPYQNVNGDVAISGKVGIGTASPWTKLHVGNASSVGNTITLMDQDAVGYAPTVGFTSSWNGVNKYFAKISALTQTGGAGMLAFYTKVNDNNSATDAIERMRIDYTGNVGIGTANPGAKLEVNGNISISSQYNKIQWPGASATGYIQNDDGYNNRLYIYQPNIIRLTNDAWQTGGGNSGLFVTGNKVGIGTASPGRPLEVNNAMKFTNTAGTDANDGVIGTGTFAPGLNIVGIQTDGGGRKVQIWGYTTFVNGHNDLAENYFVPSKVIRASLVSIDQSISSAATAAGPLHKSLIGIVSTNPGAVMDADGGFHIGQVTKSQYENEKAPIALVGTAPTLVTSQNGTILIGDPIGLSSLPGFGAKAITAGQIVGRALEKFDPSNTSCPSASSIDTIEWPGDDGKNSSKPCFKLPDGSYVGKIMVSVSVSWYDPDVNLTSTDNFHLDFNQLKNAGNNLITRIGAFGKLIVGNIQAGIIETQKLIVNGVDVLDKLNKQEQEINELKTTVQDLQQQLQNK